MSLLCVERLELKNFMTHRSEQVQLPTDGTILLWGPSGAGKSSLLDAVGFACFGLAATRASSLEELRHELYPEEDFGVRLTLSMGDGKIQIFRGVEDSKTVVWMVGADGEMTEGPRAVSEKISELMGGMDAATFFATYYSQQGELDALVKMAGGGRRKFVQRMLGITLLDKVSTQINRELLKASERIATLDDSLPQESKDDITKRAQEAESLSGLLEGKIAALQAELEALKLSGEQLAEKLKASDEAAQKAAGLPARIEALQQATIPSLEAEIARLKEEAQKASGAAERLKASAQEAERLQALQAEAESLSAAEGQLGMLSQLQEKVDRAQAELDELPEAKEGEDPQAVQDELHRLHTEVAVAESRSLEIKSQAEELQGAGSCPLCRQAIEDPAALIEELQQEIVELGKRKALSGEQEKALKERLQAAQEAAAVLEARSQAQKRLQEASEALSGAQEGSSGADAARLRQVRSELQQAAERAAQIDADRALAEKAAEIEESLGEKSQQLEKARQELKDDQASLASLEHDPEAHNNLKQETDKARERYMVMRDQLAELREGRATAQATLKESRAALEHYDATVKDRHKAEARHGLLKRLDASMKTFKGQMIGQIRPALQAAASGHLSALTEGKMSGVLIDEDYNIEVVTPAGARKLSLCSGGEQARAAFALRLALTQLVSTRTDTPVGFMVFDEIFGSQDEDHRRAILESLRYLRGLYPQVMLISHESTLRESDLIDTIVDVPSSEAAGRIAVSAR